MIGRNGQTITPKLDPYQQLDNYQRQFGLGQYAPAVHDPTFMNTQRPSQGVPGYAAGPGQTGGNVIGSSYGGSYLPGYGPSAGSGNIGLGSDWGYGSGYQPNPIMQPRSIGSGIGGSTPFLSNIQQQLGQMFGQTPGLGFRPQQQPMPQQFAASPVRSGNAYAPSGGSMSLIPQSAFGASYSGSVPLRSPLSTAASPMMKIGSTYQNSNRGA